MPKKKIENRKILNYYPAQIYDTKSGTYVGYYVFNPFTGKMHRMRIKLNRIKNKRERIRYARELIKELNYKLSNGWNPFLEQEAPKSFTKLEEAINIYLEIKQRELSKDSFRSYKSNLKIFYEYLKKQKEKDWFLLNISSTEAINFINYLYIEKELSAKRVNAYLTTLKTFWNWLIENQYVKTNIFSGIKKKKEKPKSRVFIEKELRDKIFRYFKERGELEYLAICYLTFYGLIRPKEILLLRSSDLKLKENIIIIRAENSKTGKERIVTIPDKLKNLLLQLGFEDLPQNMFLFSTGFKPGYKAINSRAVGKRWAKMRKDLNLDNSIQFYGLKDSGIIEMLRAGVSPEAVRDQAGHSSLEMTNRYVQIVRTNAEEQIKNIDF